MCEDEGDWEVQVILTGENLSKSDAGKLKKERVMDMLKWGLGSENEEDPDEECEKLLDSLVLFLEEETGDVTNNGNSESEVIEIVEERLIQTTLSDWKIGSRAKESEVEPVKGAIMKWKQSKLTD